MGPHPIDDWLQHQDGLVAVWQLVADGHNRGVIRHATGRLREVHHGVYLSGHSPPTPHQRWRAATLTAPESVLTGPSGLAFHELLAGDGGITTISRPGTGGSKRVGRPGPGRLDPFVVRRSTELAADTLWPRGIPVLSPGRLILDELPAASAIRAGRLVRDARRLRKVSTAEFRMLIGRHHGRRGVNRLRALADEYAPLPLERTRSDAEALALAILQAAGVAPPRVNVYLEGEEADLSWLALRLIVELDGPSYHQFPERDARKQAKWEAAGWTVRRLPTDDVYDHPHRLLAACPPAPLRANGRLWLP